MKHKHLCQKASSPVHISIHVRVARVMSSSQTSGISSRAVKVLQTGTISTAYRQATNYRVLSFAFHREGSRDFAKEAPNSYSGHYSCDAKCSHRFCGWKHSDVHRVETAMAQPIIWTYKIGSFKLGNFYSVTCLRTFELGNSSKRTPTTNTQVEQLAATPKLGNEP